VTSPENDSISKGGVSASERSLASVTRISTSPVGRSLFTVSGERLTTEPLALSTSSERSS
jgi:hypothetical protein